MVLRRCRLHLSSGVLESFMPIASPSLGASGFGLCRIDGNLLRGRSIFFESDDAWPWLKVHTLH